MMEVDQIKATRGRIDVYFKDGRVVRILGEMLVNGFFGEITSIREWKVPEGKPITEDEKKQIFEAIDEVNKMINGKIELGSSVP